MVLAERIGSGEAEKGRGIAGDSWALAKTHFCKIVVASLVPFTMMHWCLDVTQLKMTVKRASPQLPWHSEVISLSGKNHERSLKLTGVPKDVLTDSRRANVSSVNLCPLISPNLVGDIPIKMDVPSLEAVENEFPEVGQGGRFGPKECTSRHRVAILVPYRNRSKHLKIFIYNIHKVLSRQQIDYGIFVIEQGDAAGFNRAKLLNVGYVESAALYGYQCFIFHDVDMVPLDDRNVYTCPEQPRHMSVNVNNKSTLQNHGYKIYRRPQDVARYFTLAHVKSKPSEKRMKLLKHWRSRVTTDGLNSLKYRRLDIAFKKLYTWILVDLREPK
ncbi:beta-1,4-N-acetylgalactosaminyltransferase bre-4 isoform X5 [Dermacentor silvarum]|uniref:beta-1,4-N-acetylgalactosaminyltransferase bre-4 isoform X3 n=1 Tax=Dermacentor silvarum TaxID=543639 RepID=UPI002100F109|nr:beta-1,4-N-acetylgalactosaminyltransferase bre-4 isoform X3 [Dermacentor silvarum]XP_049522028.1 beta-1,4-N-acetylgalactosaminyltransferase bre-4 isoform X5 [Dermacentor silvarum]